MGAKTWFQTFTYGLFLCICYWAKSSYLIHGYKTSRFYCQLAFAIPEYTRGLASNLIFIASTSWPVYQLNGTKIIVKFNPKNNTRMIDEFLLKKHMASIPILGDVIRKFSYEREP